jgi:calcineurin-like phosphoesterase family protein
MNEALIRRWNSRVAADDLVYFLGDFAMGPKVDTKYIQNIIRRLNGVKDFLFGNHDQVSKWGPGLWPALTGNDGVLDPIHETVIDGKRFVMGHYPMSDWNGKQTFKSDGSIHLHGHVHTKFSDADRQDMISNKRYDIGVDMYGGPVQITDDLRYLNDPKGWA